MSDYIGFMHLEKTLVKKGDILNGKVNVGIIGNSGSAPGHVMGKHLHLQLEKELPKGYPIIRGFDQFADPSNPNEIIKKYGEMCQNTVTQPFWNYNTSINSPSICGGHHSGIDYSGVIDLPTESKYCYSPENAKCKVIAVGSDPYNYPHWGGYGNYVIIEILGKKEEQKVKPTRKTYLKEIHKASGKYNSFMEIVDGDAMVYKDGNAKKPLGKSLKEITSTKYLAVRKSSTIKVNGKYWYMTRFMSVGGTEYWTCRERQL